MTRDTPTTSRRKPRICKLWLIHIITNHKGAIPFPKKSKKTYAKGVGSRGRVGETKTDEDIVLNNDVELNEDITLNEAVAEVVSDPVINTSDAVDTVISD